MTHSTIDCVALAIRTPVGVIIHTGDFKIDPTPVDGKPFDLHAFARYGQEGVLALFSDSTNVERPGFTPSERAVVVRLEELFRAAPRESGGFLLFQLDPSHSAGDRYRAHGGAQSRLRRPQHGGQRRNRARPGTSCAFRTAAWCARRIFAASIRRKLVVLASGTQAEPMSALSRIAVDNHRLMSIAENDTVILSARIIPGNEKAIFRMIDHLFRRRVLVYYEGGRSAPIHVSGHASQEEMKILLQLVRPKYFIPMHGEYRQLFRHAALAEQVGAVSRRDFSAGERASHRIHGGRRRLSPRTGDGGARVRRFRLARRDRRSGDPRPAASFRRRRGGADHRDRQAHRAHGIAAGNRDARISAVGRRHGNSGVRRAR